MNSLLNRRDVLRGGAALTALSFFERTPLAATPAVRPNIVWIMADQLRKQALGYLNADDVSTPNLDKLAAESASFTNAISTVPICTPNRCVQFTGKYSMRTNVIANGTSLMPEHKTLGDYTSAAGYETMYIGKWHLGDHKLPDTDPGYVPPELRHGFQHFHATQGIQPFNQNYFIDDARRSVFEDGWAPDNEARHLTEFLDKRDKSKPFCAVVSFGPPHNSGGKGYEDRFMPRQAEAFFAWKRHPTGKRPPATGGYAAKPEDEALYIKGGKNYRRPLRANSVEDQYTEESKCIQGYYGAVTGIDHAVGTILASLEAQGLAKNTIVLFTADHGEMMTSHGMYAKDQPYQESIGIPLIVRYPGKIAAQSHDAPIGSVDFLPTLMGLANIPTHDIDGQNLAPLLIGHKQELHKYAFGGFYQGSPTEDPRHFRAVYTKDQTYVVCSDTYVPVYGAEVFFDRTTDPFEMKPIHRGDGHDKKLDEMQAILRAELDRIGDPYFADVWDRNQKGQKPDYSFYDRMMAKAEYPDQIARNAGVHNEHD